MISIDSSCQKAKEDSNRASVEMNFVFVFSLVDFEYTA